MSHDSNPVDLDPKTRLHKVVGKLSPFVAQESKENANLWVQEVEGSVSARSIILLQEIGESWVGPLHAFFQQNGYHLVTSLYGKKDSDYFGVGIAFPSDKFELIDAKVVKPSDWKKWPIDPADIPRKSYKLSSLATLQGWKKLFTERFDLILWFLKWILLCVFFFWCIWIYFVYLAVQYWNLESVPMIPWKYARDRANAQIILKLRAKDSDIDFVVSTYHMPCTFWSPPVMVIHSALAMQIVQEFAGSLPYILGGDFNFMPDSSTFKLYTEGGIKSTDPTYPTLHPEDKWTPALVEPVQSAYSAFLGREPEFTNHASNYGNKFTGTLDYLFISRNVSVLNVLRLGKLSETRSTFPNRNEPSDHIMIGSILRIPRK
eukprot:TRINITY_DN15174_c0_g1_i1.p1 TRINITY_DN15174_c0_g1~~TRINITY_DN15174_c0_g1_i1.p1  ORF type:complete len:431 (+),score=104.73 TRINITY_DN15174_c0_g1_i1:171-1295(+)